MDFEYDPAKSEANKIKHGIDFEEAKAIWGDGSGYEFPVSSGVEPRFLVVGMIDDKLWTAVITYRSDRIRIISARRASGREADEYNNRRGI